MYWTCIYLHTRTHTHTHGRMLRQHDQGTDTD
jgi:hypothetical protein